MNIKKIISVIMIVIMTSVMIPTVQADTGYDVTAPVIRKMVVRNSNEIDAKKTLDVTFKIIEAGSGVNMIGITFVNEERGQYAYLKYQVTAGSNNGLLFSGTYDVSLDITAQKTYFVEGTYEISNVVIYDANGNKRSYDVQSDQIDEATKEITVKTSNVEDTTAPIIESVIIDNADQMECNKYFSGTISVKEDTALSFLELTYKNDNNEELAVRGKVASDMTTGTYNIDFCISGSNMVSKGSYSLTSVEAYDKLGNIYYEEKEAWDENLFTSKITVISLPTDNKEGIGINRIEVLENYVVTPNVLTLNVNWNPGTEGITSMRVSITNENGNKKALCWQSDEPVTSKNVAIKFPLNTYLENGDYHIDSVTVYSKSFKAEYKDILLDSMLVRNHDVKIRSRYEIAYYGSTANVSGVTKTIESMNDGEVAIAEYSVENIASKEIFESLAGRDVTLVFEGPDVQWVFYGKDVDIGKCKSIDLAVKIRETAGRKYGYADDEKVLAIEFADNGELPGKATIRISNEYLEAKYGYKSGLVLSYYDNTPEVLDENIDCAGDGYAEIEIYHNSTYILSDHEPRLAAPGNITVKSADSRAVALSWNQVYGALGYKVYRSESANGTYSLVKTVMGGRNTTYSDISVKAGGQYYYRVCAYGKDVNAIYSVKKSIRVMPGKAQIIVKSKKAKTVKISLKTPDNIGQFEIYTSKNGKKYKKVKTVKNKKTITIKRNGKIYIKVRAYAEYKGKKYYGQFSKVKKIKK